MARPNGILVALVLAVVGVAGVGTHSTRWLSWLILCTAVAACGLASSIVDEIEAGLAMIPMAAVTLALGCVGLAQGATPRLAWATLAVAVAFAVVGGAAALRAAGSLSRRRLSGHHR